MSRATLIAIVVTLVALARPASADELHVPSNYETIQAAIDVADGGDAVIVAPGVYTELIDLLGKAIELRSSDGPERTVIDGAGAGTVVLCTSGEGTDTVIQGFTITGGVAANGGLMRTTGSMVTVRECIFHGGHATSSGGAMYNASSRPRIVDCLFIGNDAVSVGGAIANEEASPHIARCRFDDNRAGIRGGAVATFQGHPVIRRSTFVGNRTDESDNDYCGGGAIGSLDGRTAVIGCRFLHNSAGCDSGAAIYYDEGLRKLGESRLVVVRSRFEKNQGGYGSVYAYGDAHIEQCDFSENDTSGFAGWEAMASIYNSRFWRNDTGCRYFLGGQMHVTNCTFAENGEIDVSGDGLMTNSIARGLVFINPRFSNVVGFPGEGNIDADPLFVDLENGDLRLSAGSPCIDAGDNGAIVGAFFPFDLDGNPRLVDDPATPDTGLGEPPVIDLGAYEFQGLATTNTRSDAAWEAVYELLDVVDVFIRRCPLP